MSATIQSKPKLPRYINLLLVVALGILAAKLMWLIITPKSISTGRVQAVENASIQSKEKIDYGKLIANQHLFGEVEAKKAPVIKTPKATKTTTVAPTKLNLKLHGIVSYKSNNSGYALISSSNGPQRVYGKGDSLQDGVTVSEIFSDKVVLDNNGKNEELLLPVKKSKSTKRQKSTTSNLPNPLGFNDRKSYTKKSDSSANVDLSAIRQEALSNPQKILDVASPSPAIVNGKFLGFRVRPGRKRKLFRQLGFRPNDIITEVNGIILDDASKGAMVLGELAQASDLSVTVKRGSQEIILQHSF
jgi:general secretion pathway protein C